MVRTSIEEQARASKISISKERGAVNRLLVFVLLSASLGLASCGYAPASTAVTCTSTTSTSSTTTSTSTCTDPVTNISVTISPATVSVSVVTTQLFQDSISGGTNFVTIWQVNSITGGNDTIGRIDSNGVYHAPVSVPSPNTVTVTAISFEDQKVSASSTVTITPAPIVTITSPTSAATPPTVTVSSGSANTVDFSATETGGTTNVILWSVGLPGESSVSPGNSTVGMINANGVYSAPATPPVGQVVTVTATAQDSLDSTATFDVMISGYSRSSLQGQFAFSLSGTSASGRFFRAGSFVADGTGGLNSVLEDVNTSSSVTPTPISTTGSYTVGADGRGTLRFNDGLTPATFNFVLVNGAQLQIIGFDSSGTASGQASAQSAATFSGAPLTALRGTYVFDFAGVHGANRLSQIGEFSADGAGNVTQALIDINDGGTLSSPTIFGSKTVCAPPQNTTPTPPPPSSYSVGSDGRGTLTLNTYDPASCNGAVSYELTFYVVSLGGAKFVGTDPVMPVGGFSTQQAPNATMNVTALNGSYAFLLSGSNSTATIATAGSFTADGNGNVPSGEVDENLSPGAPAPGLPIIAHAGGDSYTVASNGRGTAMFTTASRTYTFVFYLGSVGTNTSAVFQETDSGISSDGTFTLQQGAPFSLSSIQGNYALATSGVSGTSVQDSTGQIAASGTGSITAGNIDTNTGGTTLAPGQAATGSYTAPDPMGRSLLTLNSSSANFAAYVVSPTQIFLLGIQSGQPATGTLLRQF